MPDKRQTFSEIECATLNKSLERVFAILGDELPYEICADEASAVLAGCLGVKPPLEYHDPDFQRTILRDGSRDEIIRWLSWNDPNGCYSDQDSSSEGISPLSLDRARQIMHDQCERGNFKF